MSYDESLVKFYTECLKNSYLDMNDEKQALKAKVIAMDLGLKYRAIGALFESAKKEYDKIKDALDSVKEKGYGVVTPTLEEMTLEDPQIVKKGGGSMVRLKASAPRLHIMRVDVETEVCPAVGTPEQSESLMKYLTTGFENNPQAIWDTNMFGRPLSTFVQDGIATKLANIPEEAEVKMRKTMTKIVNENKGGIICILL